jgi:hypothetical protein
MGYETDLFTRGLSSRRAGAISDLLGGDKASWLSKLLKNAVQTGIQKMSGAGGLPGMIIAFVLNKMFDPPKSTKGFGFLPPQAQQKYIKGVETKGEEAWTSAFKDTLGKDIMAKIKSMPGSDTKAKTKSFYQDYLKSKDKGDLLKEYLKGEGMFDHSDQVYDFAKTWARDDDLFSFNPKRNWGYAKNFSLSLGDKIIDADKLNVPDIDFDDEGNIVKSNFARLFGNKAGPSTKHMNIHKNLHSSPLDLTATDEELEEIFSALEDVLGDG